MCCDLWLVHPTAAARHDSHGREAVHLSVLLPPHGTQAASPVWPPCAPYPGAGLPPLPPVQRLTPAEAGLPAGGEAQAFRLGWPTKERLSGSDVSIAGPLVDSEFPHEGAVLAPPSTLALDPMTPGHNFGSLAFTDHRGGHVCPFCGKSFLKKFNLTTHIRIHTGERPYACPKCWYRANQRSHLKAHVVAVHKGDT
ncbi:hypothetical protein Pcinc_038728 [Petrolisthes cinctipes]|uniref:C2H2-type domain-containing protein n=1 Tax=Petrolisthes cinctipes TaxID=88211 RepID=A0AAE1ELA5_PETCI|nr:hypothetical protein Pcinc_042836 [Petrolisthes cinctipes]KAK3854820.1 hypothetical protein Pcinc_038728 [Petrolisthes cinctipes]